MPRRSKFIENQAQLIQGLEYVGCTPLKVVVMVEDMLKIRFVFYLI